MSIHTIPAAPSATEGYPGLLTAVSASVRVPVSVAYVNGSVVYTFTPDLSAGEATTFADIVSTFRARDVSLTVAEYRAIKPDIALLRTYEGIASPTLVQTVAATKAQSRILRALIRDG